MIPKHLLIVTTCAALLSSPSSAEVRPPFPVSLYADCTLGGSFYHVRVFRVTATMTRIVFKPDYTRLRTVTLEVPGVLSGFQNLGPDLILEFDGPTTRVYTEVDGTVRETMKCTSRFGAIPLPILGGRAVGCLRGEKMVGNLWLPLRVQIYLGDKDGYHVAAEVPFEHLYEKLGQIQKGAMAESMRR